jgi:hypothetical protein
MVELTFLIGNGKTESFQLELRKAEFLFWIGLQGKHIEKSVIFAWSSSG